MAPAREVVEAGACVCGGFMPGLTWSPDGQPAAVIPSGSDLWGLYVVNAMASQAAGG
jgi:hypothetical protein